MIHTPAKACLTAKSGKTTVDAYIQVPIFFISNCLLFYRWSQQAVYFIIRDDNQDTLRWGTLKSRPFQFVLLKCSEKQICKELWNFWNPRNIFYIVEVIPNRCSTDYIFEVQGQCLQYGQCLFQNDIYIIFSSFKLSRNIFLLHSNLLDANQTFWRLLPKNRGFGQS